MREISIGEVILPGSLISIQTSDNTIWSINIVYRSNGNILDIPLTQDIIKSCLFIDSKITIKFKNDQFEYLLRGSVCEIILSGLPYISVKIDEYKQNANYRLFPRRDVMFPANIAVPGNEAYFCIVSNISLGGISFLIGQDIPESSEYEINICLNGHDSIYAKGIINKNRGIGITYEFRMQFTYMNEEHSTMLHNCMHDIEKSYDLLRNKYLSHEAV